jgi:hypothetical protein
LKILERQEDDLPLDDVWHWQREFFLAQSGLTKCMPGPVKAPNFYRIDETKEGAWIWMEHIESHQPSSWVLDDYVFAAHQLGTWNGKFIKEMPQLSEPWLARQHYRSSFPNSNRDQVWQFPLHQKYIAEDVRSRIVRLWSEHEMFYDVIETLPHCFSHLDSQRRNLFIRRGIDEQDELVLVDWAMCGLAPLGAELTGLVGWSVCYLALPSTDLSKLDKAAFESYLLGLHQAGWSGETDLVRLGYLAWLSMMLAVNWPGLIAWGCSSENHQWAYKAFNLAEEELYVQELPVLYFALNCADEARQLMISLTTGDIMTTVREARQIAKDWVDAQAPNIPNYYGAFLIGSILWKDDDDPFPPASDVDIRIVLDIDPDELMSMTELGQKHDLYQGITIDSGFNPIQDINTPEQILENYFYASSFSVPNILSDPSGQLSKIQKAVSEQFTKKKWVIKRIDGMKELAISSLNSLKSSVVMDCGEPLFFALISIAQIPALADLRDPTTKKCLVVFQELMKTHGKQELHKSALEFLGCRSMDQGEVLRHYQDLSSIYGRAVEINQSPGIYNDYFNELARAALLDSLWEMVTAGFHRETMFGIIALRACCRAIFLQDAVEEEQVQHEQQYQKFLAELGLRSKDDLQQRAEDGRRLLDEVMQVALEIVDTNKKIIN